MLDYIDASHDPVPAHLRWHIYLIEDVTLILSVPVLSDIPPIIAPCGHMYIDASQWISTYLFEPVTSIVSTFIFSIEELPQTYPHVPTHVRLALLIVNQVKRSH